MMLKRYFITGLVILLPLVLTIGVIIFVFNLLTEPFAGLVAALLERYNLLDTPFLFLKPEQFQQLCSKLLVLAALVLITISIGAIARWFFVHYLLKIWDSFLHRIPFIRTVYKTSQGVINTVFSNGTTFRHVVLVPFPNRDTRSIGIITQDNIPSFDTALGAKTLAVFVPTAPNPTSGFLMAFKEEDVIFLDMPVEEALKTVIACGSIIAPFKPITKEEAFCNLKGL